MLGYIIMGSKGSISDISIKKYKSVTFFPTSQIFESLLKHYPNIPEVGKKVTLLYFFIDIDKEEPTMEHSIYMIYIIHLFEYQMLQGI
jgi:hypothetical protein